MIDKLYDEDLEDYVHIKDIGAFGGGEATLVSIEGGEYPDAGESHGYEGYGDEGYDDEDEALEDYLKNHKVYVFSKDIGQSGCNWIDEDSMLNYLDDVYIDLDDVRRAEPEAKKIFKGLGIGASSSEKQSKTLVYTVKIKIDEYEGWEDDYDSFEDYVDEVVSDAQDALDKIAYYHEDEGVTVDITQQ
jgi:hypothetical protein